MPTTHRYGTLRMPTSTAYTSIMPMAMARAASDMSNRLSTGTRSAATSSPNAAPSSGMSTRKRRA